jgi:hypothetical protein
MKATRTKTFLQTPLVRDSQNRVRARELGPSHGGIKHGQGVCGALRSMLGLTLAQDFVPF